MSSPAPLREELLHMLRCPESRQAMILADEEFVDRLNAAVGESRVKNAGGETLSEKVEAALIREDGQVAYPIIDNIPRLTKEEGIAVEQFAGD